MSALLLSAADQISVRSSWADVLALNHFNHEDFVGSLFQNVMASDSKVKSFFDKPAVLKKQKDLLTEMFDLIMMYLDKIPVLDECMRAFIQENPSVVEFGDVYLEPLGSVLIVTLRQTLGGEYFHASLEALWIKIFIYLANSILQTSASDIDSVTSDTNQSSSSVEDEIQPLNCKSFASPQLKLLSCNAVDNKQASMNIDLESNDKYRGFRRSVNINASSSSNTNAPHAPASIASPSMFPTSSKADDCDIPPRSQRRCIISHSEISKTRQANLELFDNSTDSRSFDPRRKFSHRRMPSDLGSQLESSILADVPCAGAGRDTKSHNRSQLDEDSIDFGKSCEPHPSVFDPSSFGIAALDPIAESEDDDGKSSYSSLNASSSDVDDERQSEDTSSSEFSDLSLHNLDHKSSISSASGYSRFAEKGYGHNIGDYCHQSQANELPKPYAHIRLSSSVPSFSSKKTGQRASTGFMKSSFILKKDMIASEPNEFQRSQISPSESQNGLASRAFRVATRSSCSLPIKQKSQVFGESRSQAPGSSVAYDQRTDAMSQRSTMTKKTSFRSIIRGLFGGSSTSSPSLTSKPISKSRTSSQTRTMEKYTRRSTATSSIAPTISSCTRISSMDIRGTSAPSGYSASVFSKPIDAHDNVSTTTNISSKCSFSFSKRMNKSEPKKTNKYLVKKVAYKTVYLKDLVS